VELFMTDNTIRCYSMKKIHEYVNQKPSLEVSLAKFQKMIDTDHWFSKTGREPTLGILAEEYIRAIKTDLDCPLTGLRGVFMPAGANTPHNGWALLDGTHRLVKCLITGRSTVRVVEVTAGELLRHVAEIDRQ
jgi:hypothetical protein